MHNGLVFRGLLRGRWASESRPADLCSPRGALKCHSALSVPIIVLCFGPGGKQGTLYTIQILLLPSLRLHTTDWHPLQEVLRKMLPKVQMGGPHTELFYDGLFDGFIATISVHAVLCNQWVEETCWFWLVLLHILMVVNTLKQRCNFKNTSKTFIHQNISVWWINTCHVTT